MSQYSFVRHPGNIPFHEELWVDIHNQNTVLYKIDKTFPVLGNILGDGYVISTYGAFVRFSVSYFDNQGNRSDTTSFDLLAQIDSYPVWGDSTASYNTFLLYANRLVYSPLADFLVDFDAQAVSGRNFTAEKSVLDIKSLDEEITFIEDATEQPTKAVVKPDFSGWFSKTLTGEYKAVNKGGGNLVLGNKVEASDGSITYEIGTKKELCYMGTVLTWG
jgi:hypothetical protein